MAICAGVHQGLACFGRYLGKAVAFGLRPLCTTSACAVWTIHFVIIVVVAEEVAAMMSQQSIAAEYKLAQRGTSTQQATDIVGGHCYRAARLAT